MDKIDETLSDDAKAVFGCYFGMGRVGSSTLTFHMQKSRPTARTQAALDELVAGGFISKAPFNRFGGVVYTLLKDARPYFQWIARNEDRLDLKQPLTEPIDG